MANDHGNRVIERKVQQISTSHMLTIPAIICYELGIQKGTIMLITVENGNIVLTPDKSTTKKRFVKD